MDDALLQEQVEVISTMYFGKPFKHQAFFNSRLKTTGGRYHLNDHHLDFNPKVYEKHGHKELVNVIKHELCHYHLHLEGKGYQHRDADFKELLSKTGGSRYVKPLIDYQEVNYQQYQCKKCGSVIRRKRKVDTNKYGCRCGGYLEYLTNT